MSADRWVASAWVFSGRVDPEWRVASPAAAVIVSIWEELEPSSLVSIPEAPPLGYRGCQLREDGDRAWTAYLGVVCLQTGRDRLFRTDPGRRLERAVLATAPAGTLPPFPDF